MNNNNDEIAPDLEKASAIDDILKAFKHINLKVVLWVLFVVSLALYLLTGVYVVNPGEQAVVKRFGRVLEGVVTEGIYYSFPRPVDIVERVNVSEVRRADIGVNLPEHKHDIFPPQKIQLLTGDENVVNVEAIVHYKIKDAAKYLYNVNFSDERLLRNSVEAALVSLIGNMAVDDILTIEKLKAQGLIMWKAQEMLDKYESGLRITAFNIKAIVPPREVADAFRDVTAAKEDKERTINMARGYYNSLIPEARGKAQEAISQAESYRIEVVNMAKGDTGRFEAMLTEYQKNRKIYTEDVTMYRLYLETMERILPRAKKYIINPSADGTKKVNLKFIGAQ
ncbi:MAG TPA: FtsH protease activity modulator HflK [Candidatus Omnitrophica bacterium]|nr:FtsH protease activity modulator HflK [Candidatus Omnitrophota bacterium]